MSTFTNLNYHIVFSTKDRRPIISPDIQEHLYPYLGGAIRGEGGVLAAVGGGEDHVHLLVRHRPDQSVSKLMELVKSHSSGWMHRTFRSNPFGWQDGFGAFSVSESQYPVVQNYILGQDDHHAKRDSRQEFIALLRAHGISYDERYV